MTQPWDGKLGGLEIRGIRPKTHRRADVESAYLAYYRELGELVAVGKGHVVFLATTPYPDLQTAREGVHHRHPDAMQTTRETVIFQRKFSTGVEACQDYFHAWHLFLRMEIHGHTTPIVFHRQRAIPIEGHLNGPGITNDSLINAVVNHLLGQVIRSRCVGKHAGALAHRFQTAQDFDRGGIVDVTHRCTFLMRSRGNTFVFDSMGPPPL